MLYEELYVKKNISDLDFRRYVLLVAQNYFDDETGAYTPYAAREALRYGFYIYCLEGLKNELDYDEIMNDVGSNDIYSANYSSGVVLEVKEMAKDMAEYEKQQRLQNTYASLVVTVNDLLDTEIIRKEQEIKLSKAAEEMNISQKRLNNAQASAIEYQNSINEQISPEEQLSLIQKLNMENFDMQKWTDELIKKMTDKYFTSDAHDKNIQEVIDEKNVKIKELQKYKNMYDARNVQANK